MKYQWFEVKPKAGSKLTKLKCSHCGGYFDSLYIIAEDLNDAMQMVDGALCEQDSSIDIVFREGHRNITVIEVENDGGAQ